MAWLADVGEGTTGMILLALSYDMSSSQYLPPRLLDLLTALLHAHGANMEIYRSVLRVYTSNVEAEGLHQHLKELLSAHTCAVTFRYLSFLSVPYRQEWQPIVQRVVTSLIELLETVLPLMVYMADEYMRFLNYAAVFIVLFCAPLPALLEFFFSVLVRVQTIRLVITAQSVQPIVY